MALNKYIYLTLSPFLNPPRRFFFFFPLTQFLLLHTTKLANSPYTLLLRFFSLRIASFNMHIQPNSQTNDYLRICIDRLKACVEGICLTCFWDHSIFDLWPNSAWPAVDLLHQVLYCHRLVLNYTNLLKWTKAPQHKPHSVSLTSV